MREQDYVLGRIDEWNNKMAQEEYDDNASRKVVEKIMNLTREGLDSRGLVNLLHISTRGHVLETTKNYFSNRYTLYEKIVEGSPDSPLANIPKGIMREYFEPCLKQYKPLVDFVESVRTRFNEIFPNELSDDDIKECFKITFPSLEDYTEFVAGFIRIASLPLDILPGFSAERKEYARSFLRYSEITAKEISKAVLKNLY